MPENQENKDDYMSKLSERIHFDIQKSSSPFRVVSVLLLSVTSVCLCVPTQVTAENVAAGDARELTKKSVTFAVMGDVTYAPKEYELLERQISAIPDDVEFVFHIGDIKSGTVPCTEDIYQRVAKVLSASKKPLFIIPGDNEWNDCKKPDEAWEFWTKHFQKFDTKWSHKLPVRRQTKRIENFALLQRGVLFIGFNLVGGRVHDAKEWTTRQKHDIDWLQSQIEHSPDKVNSTVILAHAFPGTKNHGLFRKELLAQIKKFGKPVLYLHGDGHRWIHDRPFKAAKNILRVQVDQGGIASPLLVTVSDDPKQPFVFDRRKAKVKKPVQ